VFPARRAQFEMTEDFGRGPVSSRSANLFADRGSRGWPASLTPVSDSRSLGGRVELRCASTTFRPYFRPNSKSTEVSFRLCSIPRPQMFLAASLARRSGPAARPRQNATSPPTTKPHECWALVQFPQPRYGHFSHRDYWISAWSPEWVRSMKITLDLDSRIDSCV
jgi:hypothetical protein